MSKKPNIIPPELFYFCPENLRFYSSRSNKVIPETVLEIEASTFAQAQEASSQGLIFSADDDGQPIFVKPSLSKEQLWQQTKVLRSNEIDSNLEHIGYWFQIDAYSREAMADAIAEMSDDDRIDWRTVENASISLSAEQLQNILRKYRHRKKLLSDASWAVEAELENANTETFDVIDRFQFHIERLVAEQGE